MKFNKNKVLHRLHSYVGIVLCLLMFALAWSGIPALFINQFEGWTLPEHPPTEHISYRELDTALQRADSYQDFAKMDFDVWLAFINLPDENHDALTIHFFDAEFEHGRSYLWHLEEKKWLGFENSEAIHFIEDLHTDLAMPSPYGRYLTGVVGIGFLLLIFSGVWLHRKYLKESFLLRLGDNKRLIWSDLHKLIGLWMLPFHAIFAFSGAVLGVGGLLIILAAYSSFNGDREAVVAEIIGPSAELSGEPLSLPPLAGMLERTEQRWAEMKKPQWPAPVLSSIRIQAWQDQNALMNVDFDMPGYLSTGNTQVIKVASGEVLHEVDFINGGPGQKFYGLITPLHYATFGNILVKWLYALLGLTMVFICYSGAKIWFYRELASYPDKDYFWLQRVFSAIPQALVLGTAVYLLIAQLPGVPELWQGPLVQVLMMPLLIALGLSWIGIMWLVAACLILAEIARFSFWGPMSVTGVDISLAVIAALLIATALFAKRLQVRRADEANAATQALGETA